MFSLNLVMTLLSRTGLIATAAAASLLAAAAIPTPACMFSKGSATNTITPSFDSPADLLSKTPDGKAMGMALGGFGAIAALFSGGVLFYRQRRLAKLSAVAEAAIAAEEYVPYVPATTDELVTAAAELPVESDSSAKELLLTR